MKITKSQLKELIKEEVSRFQKKNVLESRVKEINRELTMLNESVDLEDVSFMVDRIGPTNKVKDVSDYELEKMLSQSIMKMNYMNDIIGWVDKDSKLHLMRNDSRILNGEDRTGEIIDYLRSQGYESSPNVPLYEELEMTDIDDMSIGDKAVFSAMNDEEVEDDLSDVIAKYTNQGGDYEGGYKDDVSVSPGYLSESNKKGKMKITKSQLKEIIKEEASRLKKKNIVENRKKAITRELRMLNEGCELNHMGESGTQFIIIPSIAELEEKNIQDDFEEAVEMWMEGSIQGQDLKEGQEYEVYFGDDYEVAFTFTKNGDKFVVNDVKIEQDLNEEDANVSVNKAKEAFSNSDEGYLKKSLEQRNPGKDSAGSTFLKALSIDELINADWEPYNHPNISSPAIGFKAPIPGKLGVAEMKGLPKDLKVKFQPAHKGEGEGAEAVAEIPESNLLVKHTTLILGPKGDGLTVWTFFPGDATPKFDPISIDKVKNALGGEGDVLYGTVEDAINLGFNFAKNGSTSLNESKGKMKITKSQLKEIIKEEVSRLEKKVVLENRKKEIARELSELSEGKLANLVAGLGLAASSMFGAVQAQDISPTSPTDNKPSTEIVKDANKSFEVKGEGVSSDMEMAEKEAKMNALGKIGDKINKSSFHSYNQTSESKFYKTEDGKFKCVVTINVSM